MSKPSSGHFQGTTGSNHSGSATFTNPSASDIIAERVKGLDLRPHPVKHFSDTSYVKIRQKVADRTATRDEYRKLQQGIRLNRRRREGPRRFLTQEAIRIKTGQKTTRNWSASQIQEIVSGSYPTYKRRKLEGHHSYSVAKYPHLANRHEVIYPATHHEHIQGWHGGNTRNSMPGKPIRLIEDF